MPKWEVIVKFNTDVLSKLVREGKDLDDVLLSIEEDAKRDELKDFSIIDANLYVDVDMTHDMEGNKIVN